MNKKNVILGSAVVGILLLSLVFYTQLSKSSNQIPVEAQAVISSAATNSGDSSTSELLVERGAPRSADQGIGDEQLSASEKAEDEATEAPEEDLSSDDASSKSPKATRKRPRPVANADADEAVDSDTESAEKQDKLTKPAGAVRSDN